MSTPQPTPELSIRDVLQQIDRRLSLIETDVRENKAKIDSLAAEIRREFNGKFNLVIGLVITTWLSVMCTLLFKL
ncbi:MAG: hypothetical protein F4049_16135 [Gemmatimonadetes bacterium]|nr:hypothetical protein [Gemmatimonadota bacterium]MYK41734.1 hypothetical protein [Gemmatimonadota bacterium]